jgi:WD40 repeat protein
MFVAYSPDGRRIASGSDDATVKIWDEESGHELQTLKGHDGIVYSVAYSPDGRRIASGAGDNTIKIWGRE